LGHGASIAGVKGGGDLSLDIDTLNDINFTTVGPVWANKPPGWPGSTSSGHVLQISNEKASIPGLFGDQTDRIASSSRCNVFGIRSDDNLAGSSRSQTRGHSITFIHKIHVSMGGVSRSEPRPAIEKRGPLVGGLQFVSLTEAKKELIVTKLLSFVCA